MKKYDKLVVVLGVLILVLASIGVFFWNPSVVEEDASTYEELFGITSKTKEKSSGISVSEECPFYALIATPLAINYENDVKNVIPLYVKDFKEPSKSLERTISNVGRNIDLILDGDGSDIKKISLDIATKFWGSSDGVILIKDDQEGYNLGCIATPIASYLTIPIVVTDEVDTKVKEILQNLGVKYSFVCGELEGYGKVKHFDDVNDIVDFTSDLIQEKFAKDVNYIAVTNPIDARSIGDMVEESKVVFSKKAVARSLSIHPGQLTVKGLLNYLKGSSFEDGSGEFTIPNDYKYALVKFEGKVDYRGEENPDTMGSSVAFSISGPDNIFGSGLHTAVGGRAERDSNGRIIQDKVYNEAVLYNRGGETYNVAIQQAILFVTHSCDVEVTITVEKLSDPVYPMMKKISSIAPYLTSYHQGVVYGKPEFAFVADDDVYTEKGEECPGPYKPRLNHNLIYASNKKVTYIHDQLNSLLAKLADVEIKNDVDFKNLREIYQENPVYIAVVGGDVVIPQALYDSYLTPPGEYIADVFGYGIPSDIIYGNIDPVEDDYSNVAKDKFTEYPQQENVVGRIVGYDAQDASALVARSIFYYDIIEKMGEDWKNTATVQTGCGTDFLKPPVANAVKTLKSLLTGGHAEPVKWYSGLTDLIGDKLNKQTLEPLGFDVIRTKNVQSSLRGFSKETLLKMKTTNLGSLLFFDVPKTNLVAGEGTAKGAESMVKSNFIFQNGHGMPHNYILGDIGTDVAGRHLYLLWSWMGRTLGYLINTGMSALGSYNTRSVSDLELGPSVTIIESCFVGKIDGLYPETAISLAHIHAGEVAYIAAATETNVAGGYLEPYRQFLQPYNIPQQIKWKQKAKQGIYPDNHYGYMIFTDIYTNLGEDQSIGLALRNAKNEYLKKDIDSTFKWVPPLDGTLGPIMQPTSEGGDNYPRHKWLSYLEYMVYGDPAFNPYVPNEE